MKLTLSLSRRVVSRLAYHQSCRGGPARFVSTAVAAQLKVFPEYTAAKDFEQSGKYQQALPLYQRMRDVLGGAMGAESSVSVELACHNARLLAASGDFVRAIKDLSDVTSTLKSKTALVKSLNLLAEMHLLNGSFEQAYEAAMRSKDVCEDYAASHHDDHDALALFSPTYGTLGLCSLYHGDLDNAETYLQLAARWAQQHHPQHQIAALSNLGAFCLFKLGTQDHPCEGDLAYAQHGLPQLRLHLSTVAGAAHHRKLLEHPLVKEAVAYWNEALAVVTTANATRHTTASGLCGVTDSAVPDMTGLGGKARTVPSSTTATTTKAAAKTGDEKPALASGAMEDLLSNTNVLNAYVSVLCNLAELYECAGSLVEKDECVSAALVAVQDYEKGLLSAGTSSSSSADGSGSGIGSGSGSGEHQRSKVAHRPVLGRVLALAAHREMSMGQAVTAEGLYRSALEHLSNPAAAHDPRFKYERAVALKGYGLLLSKWDKRAAAGEEMSTQGEQIITTTPCVHLPAAAEGATAGAGAGGTGAVAGKAGIRIPLSGMVQLPE